MTGAVSRPTIRRIMVAIDGTPSSLTALDAALELAATWGAEVEGLFIENVDLLRWASLPAAAAVGFVSGQTRPTNLSDVERQLEALAERVEHLLLGLARRRRLQAEFRRHRGDVGDALLAALREVDLVALGRGAPAALGTTARTLAEGQRGLVFAAGRLHASKPLVALSWDDSRPGRLALAVALDLARRKAYALTVITPPNKTLPPDVRDLLEQGAVEWRQYGTTQPGAKTIGMAACGLGAEVLVVPAALAPLAIMDVAEAYPGSLLFVAPHAQDR